MGPITLFDKSFLQSLSVDESVWFDNFFITNVCPLFYIETLADLEKSVRQGRTPEQEVGLIADKFPEMGGSPNTYHVELCLGNLMGHSVPLTGQIPLAGGRPVELNGKRGAVFDPSPEAKAFTRWQNREYLEIERLHAKAWRAVLSNLDLNESAKYFRALGIDQRSCRSLNQAKALAKRLVTVEYIPIELMKLMLWFLGIQWESNVQIFQGWRRASFPPLSSYAPYAAHVLTVELFFRIALASHLISTERPSNRIDIAYLFYLPFCMLFVSSDRLHRRCTPAFLRNDQEFVWGPELKTDLAKLNQHYAKLPNSTKAKGIMSFASTPPQKGDFLVAHLWDRHLPNWRKQKQHSAGDKKSLDESNIVEKIRKMTEAPTMPLKQVDFNTKKIDMVSVKRRVNKRKGSWYQVPKDLPASAVD